MKKTTYVGTLKGIDVRGSKNKELMLIIEINNNYKVLFKTYNTSNDLKLFKDKNEINTNFVFKCYETKTMTICYDYWYAFYDCNTYKLLNYNYKNEHRNRI